jgi:glucose-1-phosphate adenylyltransferase
MGNYLFDPRVLVELLEEANRHGGTDFGRDVLPLLPHRRRTFAYDFASNTVPGVRPCEERGYWRDIGTVNAYQAAQREILGPLPRFSLGNAEWPTRGNACRVRSHIAPSAAMALAGTQPIAVSPRANARRI